LGYLVIGASGLKLASPCKQYTCLSLCSDSEFVPTFA